MFQEKSAENYNSKFDKFKGFKQENQPLCASPQSIS